MFAVRTSEPQIRNGFQPHKISCMQLFKDDLWFDSLLRLRLHCVGAQCATKRKQFQQLVELLECVLSVWFVCVSLCVLDSNAQNTTSAVVGAIYPLVFWNT
ncbi:unnamed protein product [Polarella glacialis]|uniref:Uncharacterized protein n=1 Tax=Polarella glacialis TaxID=89957 RepID=A0A813JBY2_POLGL|nr:unnamed protein product [Polarella glacialis]